MTEIPEQSPPPAGEKPSIREVLSKVVPLLLLQAALILLEAGAEDFGTSLLAMAYFLAVLDLIILYKKKLFLGSHDFRLWCVVASIIISVLATMIAPMIPWGWMTE